MILPQRQSSSRNVGIPRFLRQLTSLLKKESPAIICWSDDGKSLQILDLPAMEKSILPEYYKHSKWASFQRQLNYFGFRKWTKTQTNTCTFSHPDFIQGEPYRLKKIRRKNHPENPGSRTAEARKEKLLAAEAKKEKLLAASSTKSKKKNKSTYISLKSVVPKYALEIQNKKVMEKKRHLTFTLDPFQSVHYPSSVPATPKTAVWIDSFFAPSDVEPTAYVGMDVKFLDYSNEFLPESVEELHMDLWLDPNTVQSNPLNLQWLDPNGVANYSPRTFSY